MSYSQPLTQTYSFDVGTSDATFSVQPPLDKTNCRMVDMCMSATTTWNAVTTSANATVGFTNDLDAMGVLDYATTAAGGSVGLGASYQSGTNPTNPTVLLGGDTNPSGTAAGDIPEIQGPITITHTANTGGTPAGAGKLHVTLAWY